ncbi:hypothetical protein, partial [Burkholderia oklahomensis]|uniref:hypothetical protein n=1 Tax=Burkholderia oklahomensis TaxID=342113 RepID=UPI0012FDA114
TRRRAGRRDTRLTGSIHVRVTLGHIKFQNRTKSSLFIDAATIAAKTQTPAALKRPHPRAGAPMLRRKAARKRVPCRF